MTRILDAANCCAGSWGAATGHIITAVVGAGVLTLPHAVSWLGWLTGPLCLTVFFVINIWCAFMLADVYEVGTAGRQLPALVQLQHWQALLQPAAIACIGTCVLQAQALVQLQQWQALALAQCKRRHWYSCSNGKHWHRCVGSAGISTCALQWQALALAHCCKRGHWHMRVEKRRH
jgi:hypothetical protein